MTINFSNNYYFTSVSLISNKVLSAEFAAIIPRATSTRGIIIVLLKATKKTGSVTV